MIIAGDQLIIVFLSIYQGNVMLPYIQGCYDQVFYLIHGFVSLVELGLKIASLFVCCYIFLRKRVNRYLKREVILFFDKVIGIGSHNNVQLLSLRGKVFITLS